MNTSNPSSPSITLLRAIPGTDLEIEMMSNGLCHLWKHETIVATFLPNQQAIEHLCAFISTHYSSIIASNWIYHTLLG